MKQCWKCRSTISDTNIHHVNGNRKDEKPQNLLRLCPKCHDLIQGICDKCITQKDCYTQKLQRCWAFEDALPPIYFRTRIDTPVQIKISPKKEPTKASDEFKGVVYVIDLEKLVPCYVCGRDVSFERINKDKDVICPYCVFLLCGNPRKILEGGKKETIEQWKERLNL